MERQAENKLVKWSPMETDLVKSLHTPTASMTWGGTSQSTLPLRSMAWGGPSQSVLTLRSMAWGGPSQSVLTLLSMAWGGTSLSTSHCGWHWEDLVSPYSHCCRWHGEGLVCPPHTAVDGMVVHAHAVVGNVVHTPTAVDGMGRT